MLYSKVLHRKLKMQFSFLLYRTLFQCERTWIWILQEGNHLQQLLAKFLWWLGEHSESCELDSKFQFALLYASNLKSELNGWEPGYTSTSPQASPKRVGGEVGKEMSRKQRKPSQMIFLLLLLFFHKQDYFSKFPSSLCPSFCGPLFMPTTGGKRGLGQAKQPF